LNTFELQRQLAKTRGANIFAIDTHIEISEDEGSNGIPMIVTRLAVGVKKKLLVFTWRDTEFTDTQVSEIYFLFFKDQLFFYKLSLLIITPKL
jgi:Vam6/Vps39-like protein vacuolar protein sorting-associated protein 39